MWWYDLKEIFREIVVTISISLIKLVERYKNRCLAKRLRDLADEYDPAMPEVSVSKAIEAVLDSADDTGCTEDLTVVSKKAVEDLRFFT